MKEPIKVDSTFVDKYWKNTKYHDNYLKALDAFHHMSFHADGFFQRPWQSETQVTHSEDPYLRNYYFNRLIDNRRPKESEAINQYRRDRYFPRTKMVVSKVINSLRKIVKSREWNIDYKNSEVPNNLAKENSLEEYCEHIYPKYDSIEHWAYTIGIRNMLVDPNALLCVMPLDFNIGDGEMYRPFIHIIPCKDVYDLSENNYVVFKSPYKSTFMKDGKPQSGKIIMIVTTTEFWEVRQIDDKGSYELEMVYEHGIGELPAWIMGGIEKTTNMASPFSESFISDMLPALDQAAIDFSDLEAEKSQHLHTTVWVIQTQSCSLCQGSGKVKGKGKNTKCPQCDGRGAASMGPYQELIINLNNIMDPSKSIPTPPMGILEKDTDMVKIQIEIIKQELYEACAAINMEFLMEEPLSQSGVAKEVDRDELNNFVYGIAYHLVENILNPSYYFINEMRYRLLVPGEEARKDMLPTINVPESFDILTKSAKEDNLLKMSKSDVSPEIKETYERQFLLEVFQDDPEVRDKLEMAHAHNPLPGMNLQDITNALRAGLVNKIDAVLAMYLKFFLSQILNDDSEFVSKEWEEQHKILVEMAKKKAQENTTEDEINNIANQGKGNPPSPEAALEPEKLNNKKTGDKPRKVAANPAAGNA